MISSYMELSIQEKKYTLRQTKLLVVVLGWGGVDEGYIGFTLFQLGLYAI